MVAQQTNGLLSPPCGSVIPYGGSLDHSSEDLPGNFAHFSERCLPVAPILQTFGWYLGE
jgi:hypothetical protein